jgi:hypothetical protein
MGASVDYLRNWIGGPFQSTCIIKKYKGDLSTLQLVKDLLHEFALPRQ